MNAPSNAVRIPEGSQKASPCPGRSGRQRPVSCLRNRWWPWKWQLGLPAAACLRAAEAMLHTRSAGSADPAYRTGSAQTPAGFV